MWDPAINKRTRCSTIASRPRASPRCGSRGPRSRTPTTGSEPSALSPHRGLNVHGHTGGPLTNGFGPDEFGSFVSSRGLQAMMLANFATGTAQEAADWVEYMNAPVGTNPNGGSRGPASRPERTPGAVSTSRTGRSATSSTSRASPTGWAPAHWPSAPGSTIRRLHLLQGPARRQALGPLPARPPSATARPTSGSRFGIRRRVPTSRSRSRSTTRAGPGSELSNAPASAKVYELDPATGEITFGDGVHGAIPPSDSVARAITSPGRTTASSTTTAAMKAADPRSRSAAVSGTGSSSR